jgi:hypothetical protein
MVIIFNYIVLLFRLIPRYELRLIQFDIFIIKYVTKTQNLNLYILQLKSKSMSSEMIVKL